MSNIESLLDCVDTPKEAIAQADKRQYLKDNLSKIQSKTPWTIERINKASDKTIDKLYSKFNHTTTSSSKKDLLSKISGVANFQKMMSDVNSSYLIRNSTSELIGNLAPTISINSHTPMEILGSHVYEKCGIYLAPVALFCTIFNHLDWQKFDEIARERKQTEKDEKDEIDRVDLINEQ